MILQLWPANDEQAGGLLPLPLDIRQEIPLEILLYHNRVVVVRVGASGGYEGSTGGLCFLFVLYDDSKNVNRAVINRRINYMAYLRLKEAS